jgi:hypothetical protein
MEHKDMLHATYRLKINRNSPSITAGTSSLLNVSLNHTMTQTQKNTPGPKESKTKSFLVNTLTLKSDLIILTLETRPEVGWVGHAVSITG